MSIRVCLPVVACCSAPNEFGLLLMDVVPISMSISSLSMR